MSTSVFTQVKERYDLRQVMRLEGQKQHGRYNSGVCPFHADSHASCLVFKNGWRCLASSCPKPKGSVLDWIAHTRGNDNPTKHELLRLARELVGDDDGLIWLASDNRTKREEQPIPVDYSYLTKSAKIYQRMLYESEEAQNYLLNRGFPDAAIEYFGFGYNGSAIVIPVWEAKTFSTYEHDLRVCIGLRFRSLDGFPKYYGLRNHNQPMLYNGHVQFPKFQKPGTKKVYVFYGEFDAALANWYSIPAMSPTNGCRSFNPEWLDGFTGEVHFVPDVGEEDMAYSDAEKFGLRGYVDKFRYPDCGKDFTDQLLNWRKVGQSALNRFLQDYLV